MGGYARSASYGNAGVDLLYDASTGTETEADQCNSPLPENGLTLYVRSGRPRPRDCSEIDADFDGKFNIYPNGEDALEVWCEFSTPGGPWTLFQKRCDGHINFRRDYDTYTRGFGVADSEYWLGLENLHTLTQGGVVLKLNMCYSD